MLEEERLQGNWFWRDLEEGLIHIRDQLQLELKTELTLNPGIKENLFIQEFYLFIPESLQIHNETYPKEQFYGDETNIIRFKTPVMSFEDLKYDALKSPLLRLEGFVKFASKESYKDDIIHELKMFANIFRSTLRVEIRDLIEKLDQEGHDLKLETRQAIKLVLMYIRSVLDHVRRLNGEYEKEQATQDVLKAFKWTREFCAIIVDSYLTAFLDLFRRGDHTPSEEIDKEISSLIIEEGNKIVKEDEILMRYSLLNKYMMEALQIKNTRIEVKKQQGPLLGMVAAGIAMLVYMTLFAWKISTFAITSFPFVALAVIFYILKDRIKEGLKDLYWRNYTRWFPDYSTVLTNSRNETLGKLNESMLFIDGDVPQEIMKVKADIQPIDDLPNEVSEHCFIYKKVFEFFPKVLEKGSRRQEITSLFRLNLHKFFEKASDSIQTRLILDPSTLKIEERRLPKAYYLTLILKNRTLTESDIKKFKILINKTGIERVFYLGTAKNGL